MFNEYPYVNLQDVNLDWILKHIKDLETNLQNFIKLNTIKYADPIIWNITKQYETNTVVIDGNTGTAYLSVQPVPAGVALTNDDYWTVIFTLNLTTSNQNITFRDDGTNVVATFASNSGDWILWNFYLYRVTQPIAINTAYLVGFNLERFSVELFIRDYINTLTAIVGDLDDLTTSDKTSIVDAINSLVSVIGDIDDLTTSDKTSIVDAINSLVSVIGDLDDLTTTDKSSIVNAINETLTEAKKKIFITPEMFGAVGDGVTDDTAAFTAMFDAAISENKNVLCKSTDYLIDDDFIIDGFYFNGNNCNLISNDKTITLNGYSALINCKLTGGRVISENGHNLIHNVNVVNFNNYAFTFAASDFETLAYGLRFSKSTLQSGAIALNMLGADTYVDSVYGYGAPIGIYFDKRNNFINNAHLWCRAPEFMGSVFVKGGTNNFITNCTCDTYQYIFEPTNNNVSLQIRALQWLNNNVQVNNSNFSITAPTSYTGAKLIGDINFTLTGFNTSSNHLYLRDTDLLEMTFTDAAGALGNTFRVYYDTLKTPLGLPAGATGFGSIGYMDQFLDGNLTYYFYSDPTATINTINLHDYFILPTTIEPQRIICQATYKISGVNTKSYIYVSIESNGDVSFAKPTDVGNNPLVELNINFTLKVKK